MRLLVAFVRSYPRRTLTVLTFLVLAGLAEGIGISALLPMVQLAERNASGSSAKTSAILTRIEALGIEPTMELLLGVVLGGVVLKALLTLLAERQSGYAVAHLATDLRLTLLRALLRARWRYFVHQRMGEFASAIALESQQAAEAFFKAMGILAEAVQAVVYIALALLVSWQATFIAIAVGGIVTSILSKLVSRMRKAGRRQSHQARELLSQVTDTLQAVKPVKAMAREPLILPILEAETLRLNRAIEKEVMNRATMEALQEPMMLAVLAVGLYAALTHLGLPFSQVAVLIFLASQILSRIGKVQKEFQRMAVREAPYWAIRRTIDEAEAELEVTSGGETPKLDQGIRFDDVTFSYDTEPIVRDVTFDIPSGEITVLVGPSGSGKTTLADLTIGLIQTDSGRVCVDGTDLRNLDQRAWRNLIGYVPQETLMLHDTIARNVGLGDPTLGRDDIERALREAGAWGFVSELPEGIDAPVGERGMRLSGGQRQRLSLARALVRQPRLLILDEATTALDPATEQDVCATLRQLRGHLTLLAICHHGAVIDIADRVYRVQGGRVELIRSGPAKDQPEHVAGRGAVVAP